VDHTCIAGRGANVVEGGGELRAAARAVDGHRVQVFHGLMR
jgi:hypothetical protein